MTINEFLEKYRTITVDEFLKVYHDTTEIKVKIDFVCDYEIETITCANKAEKIKELAGYQIANISFEYFEKEDKYFPYIECKPMAWLTADEITELINDPDYLQCYLNDNSGFALYEKGGDNDNDNG